jgi:hypothetical protein
LTSLKQAIQIIEFNQIIFLPGMQAGICDCPENRQHKSTASQHHDVPGTPSLWGNGNFNQRVGSRGFNMGNGLC